MALGREQGSAIGDLWLPVVLVVVSLFVLMAFETGQAIHDRGALADLRRSQEVLTQRAAQTRVFADRFHHRDRLIRGAREFDRLAEYP